MKLTVIVPTRNAERDLPPLLAALSSQTLPHEVLIVDSSSEDATPSLCRQHPEVELLSIPKESFNHGGTRDLALRHTDADVIVFLTQDAVPADGRFLEELTRPLREGAASLAYARQLPKADASPWEALTKRFNYPEHSSLRSSSDLPRLGIKTFFFSDSAAAYRRDTYLSLGGFETDVKTNEDMFFAAKAVAAGERIAYVAEACVLHSHNFSLKQQYRRYYIESYEIARHRALLAGVPAVSEGKKLFRFVAKGLLKKGRVLSFFRFGLDCAARLLGYRAGERAWEREQTP